MVRQHFSPPFGDFFVIFPKTLSESKMMKYPLYLKNNVEKR